MELAQNYGLKVVEDCAQSHGADYMGKRQVHLGILAAFPFIQLKIWEDLGMAAHWLLIYAKFQRQRSVTGITEARLNIIMRWLE